MTVNAMPLRQSLLISIALVIMFTLLLGAGVIYWHAVNKVETEMAAAMAVGSRIALNAVDDVEEAADPKRRLGLLVADFDGDRHLKAMVVQAGLGPALQSRPANPNDPAPSWFRDLLVPENKQLKVELPAAFSGHGTFILETQPYNEIAEAWEDTQKTIAIMGILCVLTMALVYRVLGRALSPLQDLSAAVSKIGNTSNPPKMKEAGPLEFVAVYRGFNQMVDRLTEIEKSNTALNEQLKTVQEEERNALARDLHDQVGPFLFAVDVDAKSIERLAHEPGDRKENIQKITRQIRDSVSHMQRHTRDILGRLRSSELVDMGLVHAAEGLLSFWHRRHPKIKFDLDASQPTFGEAIDNVFYRVAQEAISNAVRHGKPDRITINISQPCPDIAEIEILDNGSGLGNGGDRHAHGIPGMKERVALIGGKVTVEDRPDRSGVHVIARVPLQKETRITKCDAAESYA